MPYETVIGLEIHAELATETKLFCGCSTEFGAPPNSHVCPVCLGLPGALPVINEKAVEYAIYTALALNCKITPYLQFDRKNYYYPDLPKNYQISQQYLPFAKDGWVEMRIGEKKKRIGIENIHLEEDAGKNIHPEKSHSSLIDLNLAGISLVEIVTKHDMRSLEELEEFMKTLKNILLYIEVSHCKMEEGSLRFEANISIRKKGENVLYPRTEIKNLNSFKTVIQAVEYEIKRQEDNWEKGEKNLQQTRLWDEKMHRTYPMRGKEEAHDYRYFPEPDLPPLFISDKEIEKMRRLLPELPRRRKERFISTYKLTEHDADLLTSDKERGNFFEECIKQFNQPKEIAHWISGPIMRHLNERSMSINESRLTPLHIACPLRLVKNGKINENTAKNMLEEIFSTGKMPDEIVKEKGLLQVTDEEEVSIMAEKVIKENKKAVDDFKRGERKAIDFLVGEIMKLSKGKANPNIVKRLLNQKLKNID